MRSTTFRHIIRSSWKITRSNKILWVFGVFASFIPFGGVYESILLQILYIQFPRAAAVAAGTQQPALFGLEIINGAPAGSIVAYFLAVASMAALFIAVWFVISSQILIIRSAASLYQKKNLRLSEVFSVAADTFWPVLGTRILERITIFLILLLLSIPLLLFTLTGDIYSNIIISGIFIVLYLVFAAIVSFISVYAINYIVISRDSLFDAIHKAVELFKKNVVLSLELAFLLFVTRLMVLLMATLVFFIIGVPVLSFFLVAVTQNFVMGSGLALAFLILLATVIIFLVLGIFSVFYLSTWTVAFVELQEDSLLSKAVRAVESFAKSLFKRSKKYIDEIDVEELNKKAQPYITKAIQEAEKGVKVSAKYAKERYIELEPTLKKEIKEIVKEVKQDAKKAAKTLKTEAKKAAKTTSRKTVKRSNRKTSSKSASGKAVKQSKRKTAAKPASSQTVKRSNSKTSSKSANGKAV